MNKAWSISFWVLWALLAASWILALAGLVSGAGVTGRRGKTMRCAHSTQPRRRVPMCPLGAQCPHYFPVCASPLSSLEPVAVVYHHPAGIGAEQLLLRPRRGPV
jgi:hypothetical protein